MNKIQKWEQIESRMALDHHWCRVRQDTVKLPNGKIIDDFFVNVRPDIAVIFSITEQQEIVLVRQYRHGVNQVLLELPAGSFNPTEEQPEAAASRELTEETGYVAESMIQLATLYDNPVKDTNSVHLFLAQNVKKIKEKQLDITEEIDVVLVPVEKIMDFITQGKICVTGTIAAIFLGLKQLNLEWESE